MSLDELRTDLIDYYLKCILLGVTPIYDGKYTYTYDISLDKLILSGITIDTEMVIVPDIFDEINSIFNLSDYIHILSFGKRLKVVGSGAFYRSNLTVISFDTDSLEIKDYAFAESIKLEEVNCENITFIGNNSFYYDINLCKINLKNVKSIGKKAFTNTGIINLNLVNVNYIGAKAFCYCSHLSEVYIGPSLEAIKGEIFKSDTKLSKVSIDSLCNEFSFFCFLHCGNFKLYLKHKDEILKIATGYLPEIDII